MLRNVATNSIQLLDDDDDARPERAVAATHQEWFERLTYHANNSVYRYTQIIDVATRVTSSNRSTVSSDIELCRFNPFNTSRTMPTIVRCSQRNR